MDGFLCDVVPDGEDKDTSVTGAFPSDLRGSCTDVVDNVSLSV